MCVGPLPHRPPLRAGPASDPSSGFNMTMKETQQIISGLKRENFDLKLRLFFYEERLQRRREEDSAGEDEVPKTAELETLREHIAKLQKALFKAQDSEIAPTEDENNGGFQHLEEPRILKLEEIVPAIADKHMHSGGCTEGRLLRDDQVGANTKKAKASEWRLEEEAPGEVEESETPAESFDDSYTSGADRNRASARSDAASDREADCEIRKTWLTASDRPGKGLRTDVGSTTLEDSSSSQLSCGLKQEIKERPVGQAACGRTNSGRLEHLDCVSCPAVVNMIYSGHGEDSAQLRNLSVESSDWSTNGPHSSGPNANHYRSAAAESSSGWPCNTNVSPSPALNDYGIQQLIAEVKVLTHRMIRVLHKSPSPVAPEV
ncbi:hypothetical protein NHX12_026925 [Muraenolepis orangiensis]|uniref:Centrosomin N-terminal motif 1 domain-containing protein n=1 Tax=Muraenolepis orangiensis TaxID=630683 RepID=A0A9Q0INS1_9TELE|nr:hypothetical protein NHX12_026925 [Muraenolepis orangiensis]